MVSWNTKQVCVGVEPNTWLTSVLSIILDEEVYIVKTQTLIQWLVHGNHSISLIPSHGVKTVNSALGMAEDDEVVLCLSTYNPFILRSSF